MKDIKKEANELIEKFKPISMDNQKILVSDLFIKAYSIRFAIASVENTIKVLEELAENTKSKFCGEYFYEENTLESLDEQTELLNELKGRL